jgi:hypothetical protein
MFSRLETIFRTEFRHTEKTDTRQEIKRNHNQRRDKKENKKNKDSEIFSDDDFTTVSIKALIIFLKNLIKNEIENENNQNPEKSKNNIDTPKENKRAGNPKTAMAINAYEKSSNNERQSIQISEDSNNAVKLTKEEIIKIKKILEKLDTLSKQNYERLNLKPAPTFLESLDQAMGSLIKQIS